MPKNSPTLDLIVDTREQNPYTFKKINPSPNISIETLHDGDYSLKGFEASVVVERKSLIDAFSTFGRHRQRFERQLERMKLLEFAAIVVEADWLTIIKNPPARSQFRPKSFYASVIAWQQRYQVHFWMCVNREFAEKTTYRILERFYKDKCKGELIGGLGEKERGDSHKVKC